MGPMRLQVRNFFLVFGIGSLVVILWPLIKFLIGLIIAALVVFGVGMLIWFAARVLKFFFFRR